MLHSVVCPESAYPIADQSTPRLQPDLIEPRSLYDFSLAT